MSDSVREAPEELWEDSPSLGHPVVGDTGEVEFSLVPIGNYFYDAGYQAATAAADAEWRGVVEKLVEAAKLATDQPILAGTITKQILQEALAQAEKLMGRKG